MKNVKYRAETLSPFDLRGTEEHLSDMAAQGWRLESIGRFLWRYRRAEPARVHYAVTAPPAAGEDGDLRDRMYFEELCAAAGWEKAVDWEALQIYASEAEDPTPLETDEALLLERVHQSMQSTYLRNRRNQLFCYAVLLALTLSQVFRFPHSYFLSPIGLLLPVICFLSLLGEGYAIAGYFFWLRRSRRSVEEGGAPAPVSRQYRVLSRLSTMLIAVLYLGSLYTLFPLSAPSGWAALVALLTGAFVFVVILLDRFLQRRGVSRSARIAAGVLLCFLFLLPAGFENFHPFDFLDRAAETPSYTWRDETWDLEPQPLPVTVADVTGEARPHVRRTAANRGRTPFASETFYSETAAGEDGLDLHLAYTILDAPNARVYRAMLDDMLKTSEFFEFRAEDPAPWGAEAVYRRHYRDGRPPLDEWVLCWPGRVVNLYTENLTVTPDEISAIGARLAPGKETEK